MNTSAKRISDSKPHFRVFQHADADDWRTHRPVREAASWTTHPAPAKLLDHCCIDVFAHEDLGGLFAHATPTGSPSTEQLGALQIDRILARMREGWSSDGDMTFAGSHPICGGMAWTCVEMWSLTFFAVHLGPFFPNPGLLGIVIQLVLGPGPEASSLSVHRSAPIGGRKRDWDKPFGQLQGMGKMEIQRPKCACVYTYVTMCTYLCSGRWRKLAKV